MAVGGTLFDTGTLIAAGGISGGGTIVVERGGALEIGAGASVAVVFGGSGVAVTLDAPLQYHGTLTGFGLGDTLDLKGLQGSSASVVNQDTLVVFNGTSAIDTIALEGDYAGAAFSTVPTAGHTVVVNTGGAPARDGLPITLVSVSNSIGLAGSLVAAIEQELTYAAEAWGQ